jgi:glycerol-3-phosphate acyltransferase PlsY
MIRLACLLIGYLIGCIQTAYLTGKIKANIDIRNFGSGNAGTTNIARELGFKTGVFVFVVDVLKAVLAFVLCRQIFAFSGIDQLVLGFYAGAGVILGHNFPVFFGFKGGKGIACSLGVILCVDWRAALIIYAVGVTVILLKRYISLGSIVMLVLFPISTFLWGKGTESIILASLFSALAIFQHRGNIKRLFNGTERKITLRKRKKE